MWHNLVSEYVKISYLGAKFECIQTIALNIANDKNLNFQNSNTKVGIQ